MGIKSSLSFKERAGQIQTFLLAKVESALNRRLHANELRQQQWL